MEYDGTEYNPKHHAKMIYCQKCIMPSTLPNSIFDEEQVCLACRQAEVRANADWGARQKELHDIVGWAQSQGRPYDCVVGVSGGKDSTFQALYARDKLGLHCLLVNSVPDNISDVGRANLENLIQQGFDIISIRPNPVVERHLSKRCFFEYGNFVKPTEYPLYASSYRMAIALGIPLVIQGENPAEACGVDEFEISGDASVVTTARTVSTGLEEFVDETVSEADLEPYRIPPIEDLQAAGVRAVWLGYYTPEWSNHRNTLFSKGHGLSPRPNNNPRATGRTNPYFSIDVDLKIINHNVLKYLKFGFGGVTDELCFDIREGLISRPDAIRIAERYDGQCSDLYISRLCDYLDISLYSFWENVHQWVDPELFHWNWTEGRYDRRFHVGTDFWGVTT